MATGFTVDPKSSELLSKAVEHDREGRYEEALRFYEEGVKSLVQTISSVTNPTALTHIKSRIDGYRGRIEVISKMGNASRKMRHSKCIQISDNAVGFSYRAIFSPYLNKDVNSVSVNDPYIRNFHQVQNFLRFCELLVVSCPNLRCINLLTTRDEESEAQHNNLSTLASSLASRGIQLVLKYSKTLHDRSFVFSNGYVIKIGRGLDIYKQCPNKMSIGFFEFDLRPCLETTVDIYFDGRD